jgi:non-heme chloroperoxidase
VKSAIVNGTHLSYVEKGTGAPVFFVHGSLADFRSWGPQMEPFSAVFRAVAYSRRFHYPNPVAGVGDDYSAAGHAADLAALVRALGRGPAHFVASSFGAYAALIMAAQQPELVRGLVIGEPPLLPWLPEIPGGQELLDAFLRSAWEPARRAFQAGSREEGVRHFLNGVLGPGSYEKVPQSARAGLMANAAEIMSSRYPVTLVAETTSEGFFSPLGREEVSRFEKPVLLLNAERSPRMFHLITDELARCLPQAERAEIPAASHSMHLDSPRFFNDTVLGFLEEHS